MFTVGEVHILGYLTAMCSGKCLDPREIQWRKTKNTK